MTASTPQLTALLVSANVAKIYLVEVDGDVDELADVQRFYFADRPFTTRPTDSPPNQIFAPRLKPGAVFTSKRSMWDGENISGRTMPGSIEIAIDNLGGAYDAFARHGFDGRELVVKIGGEDWAYADFATVLSVTVESVEVTIDSVIFLCKDPQDLLDKPIQDATFAGIGGAEGGPDLKGKRKPKSYGVVRNGEPVFLGFVGSCMAWAINDGPVAAYDATLHRLYDRGAPLTYEVANPPSSGKWTLDAANGMILFNGSIVGLVTADWKGDATGSGYVWTVADIIRRIVTGPGGLADPVSLDTASFTALNTAQPGACGLFVREGGNILEQLDVLVSGLGCFYGVTRAKLFQVGQFAAPSGTLALYVMEDETLEDQPPERVATEPPVYRQTLGYQRCWRPQDDGELTNAYQNTVTDGGFATRAGWTAGAGWTFSGSKANAAAGVASDLAQTQALLIGQVWRLTFDVVRTAGTVLLNRPEFAGGSNS